MTFAYGQRGQTLNTGTKTVHPVNLNEATKVFDKLITSKLAKGYRYSSASAGQEKPYQQIGDEGEDSGIRCQLLNPVDESELSRLQTNTTHCIQGKHDGRFLMVRKQGQTITGINRRGLVIAIPDAIREAVEQIPFDVLTNGEAVGETLHAFDLLEAKDTCLRHRRYIDRFSGLMMVITPRLEALRWISTTTTPNDKLAIFDEVKACGGEGVVFKDMDAPYSPGRPNSGGPQLKFKFVECASFLVTAHNTKHSVTLCLFDGDELAA